MTHLETGIEMSPFRHNAFSIIMQRNAFFYMDNYDLYHSLSNREHCHQSPKIKVQVKIEFRKISIKSKTWILLIFSPKLVLIENKSALFLFRISHQYICVVVFIEVIVLSSISFLFHIGVRLLFTTNLSNWMYMFNFRDIR